MTLAQRARQWKGLLAIYVQDGLAYRAAGAIWVLTDVATAVTMPVVWAAASRTGPIAGFTASDFVLYYLCMLMVSSFVTSHFMWEISTEIREGHFSTHIIRPVGYLEFILVRNVAWRLVRSLLFLPWFALILWTYSGSLGAVQLNLGPEFWLSVLLGHFVSVLFVTALAMIALFTQEAQAIFELYYFPMLFLSGQLFPIALFPDWVRGVALVFPFYYTTGAPTEILIGRITGPAVWQALGVQLLWVVLSLIAYRLLWRAGIRRYTGVGM